MTLAIEDYGAEAAGAHRSFGAKSHKSNYPLKRTKVSTEYFVVSIADEEEIGGDNRLHPECATQNARTTLYWGY